MSVRITNLLLAASLLAASAMTPLAPGQASGGAKTQVTVDARTQASAAAGHGEALPVALQDVGVDEHPNVRLPLEAQFIDDHGRDVRLGDLFSGRKPVVLQLGYFGCPMLCGLISHGLIDCAKGLKFKAGTDYEFVFVSVHPAETPSLAAAKKQSYLDEYGHNDESNGFHFLVSEQRTIALLAQAAGFRFKKVPGTQEIAHPAVLFVCTPDGRISRYLYGVQFPSSTLRLSLVEASAGKIGTTFDRLLLFCYHYDPNSQGYVMGAINTMRIGGVLTMLTISSGVFWLFKKESRLSAAAQEEPREGL